jgi:hypothetical protein
MILLADIEGQSLSSVIADFMICARCGIVDRECSRIIANSPCPACHQNAGRTRLYFGLNIAVLIDLIQQSYHSAMPEGQALGPQSSDVAVVLFFCALREALLNNLLDYLCRIEASDLKKVATRRKLTKRKFSSLAELIGKTWDEAVGEVSFA